MSVVVPQISGFVFNKCIVETARALIWRATQTALDRDVIIHILRPEVVANDLQHQHFFSVVRALAQTDAQVFPVVLDIISEEDLYYAIFEDPRATLLLSTLHGKAMPFEDLLAFTIKLSSGLANLHAETGLVYRNIKPAVLAVREGLEPCLFDLSLAVFKQQDYAITDLDDGRIVGSLIYISPEQYNAPNEIDQRSDLFSLGLTLYALATGTTPFSDMNQMEIIRAKQEDQLPSPLDYQQTLPFHFETVIRKLTMRSPENRYQTWEELAIDLSRIAQGLSIPRVPSSPDQLIAEASHAKLRATHMPRVKTHSMRAILKPNTQTSIQLPERTIPWHKKPLANSLILLILIILILLGWGGWLMCHSR